MMRPSLGGRLPAMIENSVVLPAPFGPMRAVIPPALAENDARSSASMPPKRFDTFSTRSRASSIVALQRSPPGGLGRWQAMAVGKDAGDAARRDGDHENEYTSVDHEIETRGIAGHDLAELPQRLDHQGAQQGSKHGP